MTSTIERCGNCGRTFPPGSICPCQNHPSRPGVAAVMIVSIAVFAVCVGCIRIVVLLGRVLS